MKKTLIIFFFVGLSSMASAQFIARLEMKEHVEGICNDKEVYALFSGFKGQVPPVCSVSNEEILKRLNAEVTFLQDKPKYKGEGIVGILINCKGQVVQCQIDNKTKSPELDKQIEAIFKTLTEWKVGTLDGNGVDTSELFSFKIKKGKFVSVN
jgi:hypothetical protein